MPTTSWYNLEASGDGMHPVQQLHQSELYSKWKLARHKLRNYKNEIVIISTLV